MAALAISAVGIGYQLFAAYTLRHFFPQTRHGPTP